MRASILLSFLGLSLSIFPCFEADARRVFPYQLISRGDRSVVEVKVKNLTGRSKQFLLGAEGQGVEGELEPFSPISYLARCFRRQAEQPTPKLTLTLEDRDYPLESFAARPSDPRPILWFSSNMKTNRLVRGSFLKSLRSVHPDAIIHEIDLQNFPAHFSALQRAQLLVIDLSSLLTLTPSQRDLFRALVAAGATLVIGTGDNAGAPFALEDFSSVLLGSTTRVGRVLAAKLRAVDGVRPLTPRGEAYPLVIVDGRPLVVEEPLGMGRVRTVGVQLYQLNPGATTQKIFSIGAHQQEQLSAWIEGMMPPLSPPPHLLKGRLFWLILLLPLIFLFSRGRWRLLLGGGAVWLLLALLEMPVNAPLQIERAQLLYIPLNRGGVVLGQLDLSFYQRGIQSIPGSRSGIQSVLLDTPSEGACQIHALDSLGGEDWWLMQGQVGERQRFRFIASVETIPPPLPDLPPARLPSWPPGPWSGAPLQELSAAVQDLPLALPIRSVQAWRLPQIPPPSSRQITTLSLDEESR
ncbi:MAG: hypothetical protein VYD19_05460 [Myxococcota bacterium]|nr:hypothetical protein [Myxococcota bacterium]